MTSMFIFIFYKAKTTFSIIFPLCLSLTLSLCEVYLFFFLKRLLILEEERLIFSPFSLESWEEVL